MMLQYDMSLSATTKSSHSPRNFPEDNGQGFAGLTKCLVLMDDILLIDKEEASHFKLLGKVFGRLKKHGFCLKQEECQFLLPRVESDLK